MTFDLSTSDLADIQQCIIDTTRRNPDMTPKQIAANGDCSASYVRQTPNEQGNPLDIDLGV